MNLLKWFKKEPKECKTQTEYEEMRRQQGMKWQEDKVEQADNAKAAWEAENELLKKLDACNLGTTHLAFNGTYEDYMRIKAMRDYSNMQGYAAQQAAQMQESRNMAGLSGQAAYGNQLFRIFG